jgi:ribose transport system permease protein
MEVKTLNNNLQKSLQKLLNVKEFFIIILIVAVGVLLWVLSPYFLTSSNLTAVFIGLTADAIIAIGMTVLLVSGGFDLSVGSVLALGGVVAALLMGFGVNMWLAMLAALFTGLFTGLLNGLVVTRLRVNPLIATLGMMTIARSATLVVSQGYPLANVSKDFTVIGQGFIWLLPVATLGMLILTVIGDVFLRKSIFFRQVYYIGGNEKAALYSGIPVNRIKVIIYSLVGILSVLAGIVTTSRLSSAFPQAGLGTEMRVISACVIGGSSLAGGEGTIFGSLLGVILVSMINNGLVLLNVSVYWQGIVSGLVLVGAVALDSFNRTRKID